MQSMHLGAMCWPLVKIFHQLFPNVQRKAYCSLDLAQKQEVRRKLQDPLQGESNFSLFPQIQVSILVLLV